jgi:hypothetical protein
MSGAATGIRTSDCAARSLVATPTAASPVDLRNLVNRLLVGNIVRNLRIAVF